MGGVARRASYLRDLKSSHSTEAVLVVETGGFTSQTDALDDPANRWVVEAFEALGLHAVNTSAADLVRLRRLAELGRLPKTINARYVATAQAPEEAARFQSQPYAIVNVRPAAGGDEVKVGILGITRQVRSSDTGFNAALSKHVPEVDAKSDIVVLLAWLPDAELHQIAKAFPAIDVILNGATTGEGRDFPRTGNTIIHESAHEGVAVGVLEIEWDARGHITKSRNQQVPLPPVVPDSPALQALVENARRDASAFGEEVAKRSKTPLVPIIFAGAKACEECHEKAYKAWSTSRHAHAIDTLKKSGNDFNRDCLRCHVTGFDVDGGFVNMLRTPQLANVQCEACHDTALDHSKAPTEKHPGVGDLQKFKKKVRKDFCLRCHTEENSPKFQYDAYWPKIAH